MFYGRQEEFKLLNGCYHSSKAELVILYGRRRIGKTETLRYFSAEKNAIFYTCKECLDSEQLDTFSHEILQKNVAASKYLSSFENWESAFNAMSEISTDSKTLVIIDEFPYMCRNNASIPSVLQKAWDINLKDKNIMLVLCGSSMSFMEKDLLAEKNPLYGRATAIYKMLPLGFYDAVQFFPGYSPQDKIAAYTILGGIPYYLEQFNPSEQLDRNIVDKILSRGSVLYREVEFLLHQELRETSVYNAIIEAVALGNNSLSGISDKTQIEKTKISSYLKNLVELGIIRKEFSVSEKLKSRFGIQRGLYRLNDEYFRFWYSFVFTHYSELESGDAQGIFDYAVKPLLDHYVSAGFEKVCIEYLRRKNRNDELPFHFVMAGRWWDKVTKLKNNRKITSVEEIDCIAVDTKSENYILGECKYTNTPVDSDVYYSLKDKFVPSNPHSGLYYYLFSKSGFTERLKNKAKETGNVFLVGLKDIVEGK